MQNLKTIQRASTNRQMGPLERAVYRSDWQASYAYRNRSLEGVVAATNASEDTQDLGGIANPDKRIGKVQNKRGFGALRKSLSQKLDAASDESIIVRDAPAPGVIAARLLLARLFDDRPEILQNFASKDAVVLVDVPDAGAYNRIVHQWRDVLALRDIRFLDFARLKEETQSDDLDAVYVLSGKPLATSERRAADGRSYVAIQLARPIMAITPSAETHLSKVLLDGATHRVEVPAIDADIVRKVIRIVTGGHCTTTLPQHLVDRIGLHELLLSVRFDRSPAECLEKLSSLAKAKIATAGSRELSLDELFGLDEAVNWARSTGLDLKAWRRGKIGWSEIDAGVVVNGPPGIGKTLFAKTVADHFGLPLVSATYAKWQSRGHLGDLLKGMKEDFEEARKSPCVFFIDELDSFTDRGSVRHDHKDYVVAVVNGFIEQIDGLHGRDGIIFVGATNDVRRCDPAIVRAGRFNRVINIGLPSPSDIEKMMRVRLRGDLEEEMIEHVAFLALGSTGADVERIVKDARRRARQDERSVSVADLRSAVLGGAEDLSLEMLNRASIHEAGHIVAKVVHDGPENVQAVVVRSSNKAGFVASRNVETAGTLIDHRRTLQRLLAGRAAEELILGEAGDGSGGVGGSDLANATKLGAALVASFGHAGPHNLVFLADHFRAETVLESAYMRTAVQEELKSAIDEAMQLLSLHRNALTEVAARLRADGRIDGHDVQHIIDGCSVGNGPVSHVG